MKHVISALGTAMFWGFIVVKVWGHSFVAWSWWWLLLSFVPWIGLLVQYWGL